ncbi:hypothetical protein HanIR_Chr02g0083411 [Helianthus annuus]|nr:hypothetical protein HanIR_Chr02g0083411 [Helianthus annuus]
MAVGVVEGTSEAVFRILMSIGPSRYEYIHYIYKNFMFLCCFYICVNITFPCVDDFRRWDFCFNGGTVVEHLDGHTDIIHMQLCRDWLPWFKLLNSRLNIN